MQVVGYLDRLSARPGEEIVLRASGNGGDVTVDLVRLLHGDANPAGPGFLVDEVAAVEPRTVRVEAQRTHLGSCLVADEVVPAGTTALTVTALVWPTLPAVGREQGIAAVTDADARSVAALVLDDTGRVAVRVGPDFLVATPRPLVARRWYRVSATVGANGASVAVEPLQPFPGDDAAQHADTDVAVVVTAATGVVVAATACPDDEGRPHPADPFDGKIEDPVVRAGDAVLAEWAFEAESHTDRAVDVSGRSAHGRFVNKPARAMTGLGWTGEVHDPAQAPEQYGAVHFHSDDLSDAGWSETLRLTLPTDLPSGVYAVRLRTESETDHVPVVVPPAVGAPRARVAFLLPTFSYIAYANERLQHRLDYYENGITDHRITPGHHDVALAEHPEWGASLYDTHPDGSGVCYSTALRPIPNLRPDYRMWLQDAPRGLGADLYIDHWLRHEGVEHDVLTDHELHAEPDALAGYDVLVTGGHPEYHSAAMLDAVAAHLDRGGSLMYLGGNGFYWVTTQDPQQPYLLEVRRSGGIRTWEAAPGEHRHSTTGEQGGLWRWRGRSPNTMLGVGMCSQGWDAKAPAFERTPLSYEPEWAWVFEGVDDHLIGDFGLIMNGASGDELDRFDESLGSPPNTAVLATSQRHSDYYQLAVEDVLMLAPGLGGSETDLVRSDMVVVEQSAGGAVFSVGSICYSGSLPVDGYRNNVAQLTGNVLRNLLARPGTS